MIDLRHWDGTEALPFVLDDGGRLAAGFKGRAGDCVARSMAIASGRPYGEIYYRLSVGMGSQRRSRQDVRLGRHQAASARNGVNVDRKWYKEYMVELGFVWVPTMRLGSGCKVHLLKDELPDGRLVVHLSKHSTAVIDGVIHDTSNPTRATIETIASVQRMRHRCVYGYWRLT